VPQALSNSTTRLCSADNPQAIAKSQQKKLQQVAKKTAARLSPRGGPSFNFSNLKVKTRNAT
jgi:hypothetical protein